MKLKKYLKPYWLFAFLSPLAMVLEVSMDLMQPKLMSKIVDDGVLAGNMELIIKTGILMFALVLLGCLGGILSSLFGNITAMSFGNDLRKDTFKSVMNLSYQQTDKFTTGSLVTRLTNDITATQDFVGMALRMFVRTTMQFVGGIIMAISLNVNFALVMTISLPIQLCFLWLLLSKASPLFGIVQTKLDKVNSVVQENVSGARVVKAYVKEDYEINRFSAANDDLINHTLKVQKLMATLNPILMVIMNVSVIAIIYIGGTQVEARNMQVGEVMAAITYITQILMSVMMLGMMFQNISRASASAKRIIEVLDTKPAVKSGDYDGTQSKETSIGTVSFKNVSFHYPNFSSKPVLNNISFDIKHGETIAVLGATGCGKTSLVNLIPRFYDASEGEILIDGVDIKEYSLDYLRSKIGFVLQKSELFSGTIAENIRWGNENASDEDVIKAAQIAQADEFISKFNNNYKAYVSEKGASLSGGQKQRMSIARAILKNPEILIFDDSTSALDLSTEAKLQKALRENLKNTTVIMIAQRIASVMNADRIAVIENGNLIAFDNHQNLMNSCEVYQDIYNSQMKKEEDK